MTARKTYQYLSDRPAPKGCQQAHGGITMHHWTNTYSAKTPQKLHIQPYFSYFNFNHNKHTTHFITYQPFPLKIYRWLRADCLVKCQRITSSIPPKLTATCQRTFMVPHHYLSDVRTLYIEIFSRLLSVCGQSRADVFTPLICLTEHFYISVGKTEEECTDSTSLICRGIKKSRNQRYWLTGFNTSVKRDMYKKTGRVISYHVLSTVSLPSLFNMSLSDDCVANIERSYKTHNTPKNVSNVCINISCGCNIKKGAIWRKYGKRCAVTPLNELTTRTLTLRREFVPVLKVVRLNRTGVTKHFIPP